MSSTTTLYITYLAKEGPFLKVWGQLDKNIPIAIDKALSEVTISFNNGLHIPPSIQYFSLGNLCCAKFSDDAYYRAKIINVDSLHEGLVEVLFIDYGNTDNVQCKNIRTMEPFSREFINIVPQAREFYLMNVTHSGSDWDPVVLEQIIQKIRYVDAAIAECIQIGSNYLIKLFHNGREISSLLKEAGYGIDVPKHIQQTLIQKTLFYKTQEPSHLHQLRYQQQAQPSTPPNMQLQLARPTILTFKSTLLEPNSEHEIYVSYVTDGPLLFSIQLKKTEENLRALMNEINTVALQPFRDTPTPSNMCLARSIEDDYICRGVVTNMVDGLYKIYYVDFGNTEMRSIDHIYEIPYTFIIPKLMATRFALDGFDRAVVSVRMKVAFKEFVENRLLNIKVKNKCVKTGLPLCDIWDEKSVHAVDVLKQAALDAYPESIHVTKGSTQPVYVTSVNSCNRFYIQLKGKDDKLKSVKAFMQESCPSRKPLEKNDVYPGKPCAAQLAEDDMWHRAIITETFTNGTVKVCFIDLGRENITRSCNLKQAHYDEITMLRPQALQCSLNGYQNMPPDTERDTFLKEILLDQVQFTAKVVDILGSLVLLDMIDGKNYNVASLLLEKLANSRSQISPLLIQDSNKIELKKRGLHTNEKSSYNGDQRSAFKPHESKDNRYDRQRNQNHGVEGDAAHRDRIFSGNRDDGFMSKTKGDGFNKNRVGDVFRSDNREVVSSGVYQNKKFERTESSEKDVNPDKKMFGRQNKSSDRTNNSVDSNSKFSFKNTKDGIPAAGKSYKSSSKASDSGSDTLDQSSNKEGRATYSNRRDHKPYRKSDTDAKSNANHSHELQSPSKVEDTPILASVNAQYHTQSLVSTTKNVGICWFHNPGSFFVQLDDSKNELKSMMDSLQKTYKKRRSSTAVVNQAVIAQYPADNNYYRAIVLDVGPGKYKVQYVDFGNISGATNIYSIEERHMVFPVHAVRCQLFGITPLGDTWPKAALMQQHFDVDVFTCEFVGQLEDRLEVNLTNNNQNIADLLITDGFAIRIVTLELPLLLYQEIKVLVNIVNSLSDFIIEVEPNVKVNCTLHNLTQATNTFEATLKELVGNFVIAFFDNIEGNRAHVSLYDTYGMKLKLVEPDEGAVEPISSLCAVPVFLSSVKGFVSHATKTSVFIQPNKYTALVAQLLETMFNMYNCVENTEPVVPKEGYEYAVLSSDENWYRGKVTSINNNTVNVHYIDYGNDETVNTSCLRVLDSSLYDPHELCIEIRMDKSNESLVETELIVNVAYLDDGWSAIEETAKLEIKEVEASVQERVDVQDKIAVQPGQSSSDVLDEASGIPIVVSHFDTPNNFYVQLAQDLDAIDSLRGNLHAQIDTLIDANEPSIGMMYAVFYNEVQEWYRAEVLDVDGDKVTIRFVDYGNREVVDSCQCKLKLLPADLQSLERYARPCSLYITPIPSETNEWSPKVCARFEELAYVDGTCTVRDLIQQTEDITYIHMYCNEINLAETLVNENYALKMRDDAVTIIHSTVQPTTTGQATISTTTDQSTSIDSQGIPVQVSHIDSPGQFYLQLATDLPAIETLHANLQSQIEQLVDVEAPMPGVLCAAIYSANEEWFRAQVLDIDDDITTVRFVDYGNTDVLKNKQTKVKSLCPELLTLEQYARRCSLYVQPSIESSDWSQEACTRFEELAYSDNVRAEILEQDDKTTYVNLFANKVNLGDVLVNEKYGQPMTFENQATYPTGFISHVNSPSEFWIQLENACGDLERIADQLERDASTFLTLNDLSPGTLCAAVFPDDDKWYRARILSNTVAGLEVLFIDYGNSCTCTNLRELPEDLVMTSALAQKCCLQKPDGVLQWSLTATDTFKQIAADGRTIFVVRNIVPAETTIVQLYRDDQDISQYLLPIIVEGYVSHFEKLDSIWIRKMSDLSKLDKWTVMLHNAKNWPKTTDIDKIVAAYCEIDSSWHRGKIIEKLEKEEYCILLIDSGARITTNDIREWPEDYLEDCEPLATRCKLLPIPGFKWITESETQFLQINNSGKTIFHVEYITDDIVQLYHQMQDVRSSLDSVKSTPNSSHQSTPSKKSEQIINVNKSEDIITVAVKNDIPMTNTDIGESPIITTNSEVSEIDNEFLNNSVEVSDNILSQISLPDKLESVKIDHEDTEVSAFPKGEINIANKLLQSTVKLSDGSETIKVINDNNISSNLAAKSLTKEIVDELVNNAIKSPEITSSPDLMDEIINNDNTISNVNECTESVAINKGNEIEDITNRPQQSLPEQDNVTLKNATTDMHSDARNIVHEIVTKSMESPAQNIVHEIVTKSMEIAEQNIVHEIVTKSMENAEQNVVSRDDCSKISNESTICDDAINVADIITASSKNSVKNV